MSRQLLLAVVAVLVVAGGIAIGVAAFNTDTDDEDGPAANSTENTSQNDGATPSDATIDSDYLDSYTIDEATFGTVTTVTVNGDTRTIVSNALPNHDTGEFPNTGNPNAISAQDASYTFPLNPTFTGTAVEARTPGVAINGVKFEPATAEVAACGSGGSYRVEALQEVTDLGLDFNNAHVQPTGEYHYHGASSMLAEAFDSDNDLVHVGFAADGHLMYYSKSGAYTSSYVLGTDSRSGTNCTYAVPGPSGGDVITFGPEKDGSVTSDWDYVDGSGDLDECNGINIAGQYVYIITEEFPYISRCLMGEFSEAAPGGGSPGGAPAGPSPGQGPQ